MKLAILWIACVLAAHATGVDGRWSAQPTAHAKKTPAKPAPTYVLDLKTQDGKLTGTVSVDAGKKARSQAIENGRVDGDKITFTTHAKNRKSDATFQWTATLNGDQLRGTRLRDGARKGQSFTARRAN